MNIIDHVKLSEQKNSSVEHDVSIADQVAELGQATDLTEGADGFKAEHRMRVNRTY